MKTKIEDQAREYAKVYYADDDFPHEAFECYGDVVNAFLAGAKAATRWIPVEEELPEKKTRCLILPLNRDYPMPARHLSDGWFLIIESGLVIRKVSHWIPMPPNPEK